MITVIEYIYIYKRVCPTKIEHQQQDISYLEREREGGDREGHAGGRWVGQQAGIFKVRIGLGEIEGRDRDTRDRETNKQRDIETELTIKITREAR
jgi:hypothetical protein